MSDLDAEFAEMLDDAWTNVVRCRTLGGHDAYVQVCGANVYAGISGAPRVALYLTADQRRRLALLLGAEDTESPDAGAS